MKQKTSPSTTASDVLQEAQKMTEQYGCSMADAFRAIEIASQQKIEAETAKAVVSARILLETMAKEFKKNVRR